MKPYLLISGDFVKTGGMDHANFALARYLAGRGHEVHLVAHRASPELLGNGHVLFHHVSRPGGSHLLGGPLLRRAGKHWAQRIASRGGHVVVNGGNCAWGDVNWVHYVHAAWGPQADGVWQSIKAKLRHRIFLRQEREALGKARVLIANSERTKRDLVSRLGLDPGKIHTVYLGVEGDMFRPARQAERQAKRAQLGWGLNTPVIAFVGAPGDRRKGFDTVFDAWRTLYQNGSWDGHLAVIGAGPQLGRRKAAAEQAAMKNVHFLGFRPDVPQILPACDALVSPSRYEPYGMGVAEAICCGLPAFVSADAGVAERYPAQLRELLLQDANDASELAGKLRKWRGDMQRWPQAVASLAQALRKCSWEQMASQIVQFIEETA